MTPMAIAGLVLAGLATAAGGVTAGLVVTTSGPFANGGNEAAPSATAALPTALVSSTPGPSSTAVAKLPADAVIQPTDQFNFDSLPDIDESGWQRVTTPGKTLSVSIPTGWHFQFGATTDMAGAPNGEWLSAWRDIPGGPPSEGQSKSGWIKIDLTAKSTASQYQSLEAPIRRVALAAAGSASIGVTAYQFGQSSIFAADHGGIDFVPAGSGGAHFVDGYGHIDLPSTAGDVALTWAIVRTAEVQ